MRNNFKELEQKVYVLISGNLPGSGSSTQQERLSEKLQLIGFSAGRIRRSIAVAWDEFRALVKRTISGKVLTEQEQWEIFAQRFQDTFAYAQQNQNRAPLVKLVEEFIHIESNDEVLRNFTQAQNKYAADQTFWDQIPEEVAHYQLTSIQEHGAVYEGKNATIIDSLIDALPNHSTIVVRFLLEVSAVASAWRVFQREMRKKLKENPDIESGYPDLSMQALLAWTEERQVYLINKYTKLSDTETLDPLEIWLFKALDDIQDQNRRRIVADNERYPKTFTTVPPEIFAFEHKKAAGNAHVIDADQPIEVIQAQMLALTLEAAPWLASSLVS